MSRAWLRGVLPQYDAGNGVDSYSLTVREFNSIIYHFLTKCLNFTHVDEVVNGGFSFNGNEQASDTDGSFSGSSVRLTISSSKFTSAMVGEFVVLKDATNEENSGVYLITNYVDANNVDIDFYVPSGTYPTSGSGISWWMLDRVNMAAKYGDYFVVESPHATSKVTLVCTYRAYNVAGAWGLDIKVVHGPASENWDAVTHQLTDLATRERDPIKKFCMEEYSDGSHDHGRIFGFGEDDGSFVSLWCHFNGGSGPLTLFMCGVVSPSETTPTHDAKDLLATFGGSETASYNTQLLRNRGDKSLDRGASWSSRLHKSVSCSMCDWADGDNDRLFATNLSGPNEYTGKYDGLPVYVWLDEENNRDAFSILGTLDVADVAFTTAMYLGNCKTFDTNNWFHITHGIAVSWPGLPTYF